MSAQVGLERIVYHQSFDNPPKPYWRIEQVVTPQGHYIELPGTYVTAESAQAVIDRHIARQCEGRGLETMTKAEGRAITRLIVSESQKLGE